VESLLVIRRLRLAHWILAASFFTVRGWCADVLNVGGRKQLFIDEKFVEQAEGVKWRVNPPLKTGLVLAGTNSWENGLIFGASTVLEDQGKYRLWYTACPVPPGKVTNETYHDFFLCYAESTDGTHWLKPDVGIYEWQGSRQNNILMKVPMEVGGGVFVDPTAPRDERYKLVGRLYGYRDDRFPSSRGTGPEGTGVYAYTSPDGLHWQFRPERLYPFEADAINMAFYDSDRGTYLAYIRTRIGKGRRSVGVVETTEFHKQWPFGNDQPGRIPLALAPSPDDPPDVDYYCPAVVKYPWADGAYLMFASVYRHFPRPKPGSYLDDGRKYHNDGLLDVTLAASRDGLKFRRVSREPYLGLGVAGARDSSQIYMTVGMVRQGDELLQYYGGLDYTHGMDVALPEMKERGGLMQARQRLDGFVSIEAGIEGGRFVTPPLVFSGEHVVLNLDVAVEGEIRVELRDAEGRTLEGYGFADCTPIIGNHLARTVTWKNGSSDLIRLAGSPVRMAFELRLAKLYAFQFVP
jgi:hypothetical protein